MPPEFPPEPSLGPRRGVVLAVLKGHQMTVFATSNYISRDGAGTQDGSSSSDPMSFADALVLLGSSDDLIVVDATVSAADLNALDAMTDGTVVTEPYVTTVTGSLSDVAAAYASSGISGLGNEAVTLSDTTVAAADLNALDAKTTGVIDASSVTTLTGAVSVVRTTYLSSGISGLGNEAVTLSDTILPAVALVTMDGYTSGTVDASSVTTLTGPLSKVAAAYASSGITGLGNEAVNLNDSTVAAADLNALDTATSGTFNAASVTTLTGTLSAVTTAYASSGITDLGNAAVTLSDTTAAAADLNALDTATSGVINPTSVTTLTGTAAAVAMAYASSGISGLGNETVTLSAGTAAASDLNAIDTATSGTIDASSVTVLTGSLSAVAAAHASAGITGLGDENVTLSDTTVAASDVNALDTATTGMIDASSVTTFTGSLSDADVLYASGGIAGPIWTAAWTLNDTTVAASDLNNLEVTTTGVIDASSVTALTGSLSDVAAAYASSGISGLGNAAVTLSDTTAAAAGLNAIDAATIGTIDASSVTVLTGTAAAVATAYASSGISGLGNENVTIAAGTAAAGDLNAINAATSGTIDASSVTTLTGTAAAVATAYASSGITGLGDEAVTLTDTTVHAGDLLTLEAQTSGVIDAQSVLTVTGSLSDLTTAYTTAGIHGFGNEAMTLTDATIAAASLNSLDGKTTGVIDASSVTTLTGLASAVAASYASSGISGLGTADVILSDTSTTASALNLIDANTTGTVNALSVKRIDGTASDVAKAYASSGISGLGNEGVFLWDTVAAAADLNAINAATRSGTIYMASILTVTGSLSDLAVTYSTPGFNGRGDEAVTLSDTVATATTLNFLDGKTTGVIDASSVTTLTGTATAVATAYASSGISGLGNENVTIAAGTAAAGDLNAIHAATSGTIDASSVTTVTGSSSTVRTVYQSGGVSGLGNEAVKLSGTVGVASDLNAINAATSGTIDASSVTTLTGSLSDLTTTYTTAGIRGFGNEAITLTDATVAATSLNYLDKKTTGVIDASSVTTLTGAASAVAASYVSSGISGLGSADVILSGTIATASALNVIDANTTGTVDALSVNRIDGTASDVATAYASSGISGLGTEGVFLWDTVAAAADLNAINAATHSGTIYMASILTVTGSLSDLAVTYSTPGFNGRGDEAVTLSDTAAAATALNSLDGKTTGVIDASSVTVLTGTATAVATAYESSGISGLGNEHVTIAAGTAAASDLNAIHVATSGVIDASSVTTLTGTAAAIATTYEAPGISGLGNEHVTIAAGTASASDLNAVDVATSGAIDASSVTTLTGTVSAVSTAIASAGISGLENAAFDITGTASAETIQGGVHGDTLSGLGGSDSLYGFGGNDTLNGGTGADTMTGGTGADSFIFVAGEANGDSVTDFSGSGTAGDGDVLVFRGYGDGASFTDLGGGHYEIANAARTVVDVIEVTGTIDVTDHRFELVV